MKLEIIYEGGNPIGYDLVPKTKTDHEDLAIARNLLFFGMGDDHIEYAGRYSKDPKGDSYDAMNMGGLKFRQKKHVKD